MSCRYVLLFTFPFLHLFLLVCCTRNKRQRHRYRKETNNSVSYQTLLTWAGFDLLESAMYLATSLKANSTMRVGKYTNQMNPNIVLVNLRSSQVRGI